jgi:DNA-binding transcriptional LysR family regulator
MMAPARTTDHNVRRLRYFVTVADAPHFRRAAAALSISPPVLTQHVNRLEADLGCRLFDRTSRWVRLTDDGQALLPLARLIVTANDRLAGSRRTRKPDGPELRLGYTPTAPGQLMRPIFRELGNALPARVTVHHYAEHEPADAVRRGEVDAAFVRGPVKDDGLRIRTLFQERRVAVVARDHPLAEEPEVDRSALADQVLVPLAVGPPDWIDHWVGGPWPSGSRPALGRPVAGFDELRQVCALGRGIGIAPASLSRLYPHPDVAYVRLAGLEPTAVLLCTRGGNDLALRVLERTCAQVLAAACGGS